MLDESPRICFLRDIKFNLCLVTQISRQANDPSTNEFYMIVQKCLNIISGLFVVQSMLPRDLPQADVLEKLSPFIFFHKIRKKSYARSLFSIFTNRQKWDLTSRKMTKSFPV